MKPEKEKIWLETGFKVITLLSHTDLSVDEQNVLHTRLLPLFKEMYEAGKSEAISNFAEKIKYKIRMACESGYIDEEQFDYEEIIDKLVEEQSSGDKQ